MEDPVVEVDQVVVVECFHVVDQVQPELLLQQQDQFNKHPSNTQLHSRAVVWAWVEDLCQRWLPVWLSVQVQKLLIKE